MEKGQLNIEETEWQVNEGSRARSWLALTTRREISSLRVDEKK